MSLKIVKESSVRILQRTIRSLKDAYGLVQGFVEDANREHFLVVCLDKACAGTYEDEEGNLHTEETKSADAPKKVVKA